MYQWLVFVFFLMITPVFGQTALSFPDMAIIGNFNGTTKQPFGINESMLEFQQYLYPDIKANMMIAVHREGAEYHTDIEEGFVSFLNPVDDVVVKIGKKKIGFGYINAQHAEDWTSIHQPGFIHDLFGEEGAVGQGGVLSYVLPLPVFTQLDFGVWNYAPYESSKETVSFMQDGVSSRLWTSIPVQDLDVPLQNLEVRLGTSAIWDTLYQNAIGFDMGFLKDFGSGEKVYGNVEWGAFFKSASFLKDSHYLYLGYCPNRYWEFGVQKDKHQFFTVITNSLSERIKFRVELGYDVLDKAVLTGFQMVIQMWHVRKIYF